ncbi:MAG: Uma2 family endonuclease, partial [Oscillatoriales cyanobacterium]
VRSPDASWVSETRWATRDPDPSTAFAKVCPDFVVELRSASDRLLPLQEKMTEYRANGVQLGWLLDPQNRRVEIYRAGGEVVCLESPERLSGEAVLPGFCLSLSWIWSV